MPATLSIISATFPAKERPQAIAIWAAVFGMGVGIGPLLGGFFDVDPQTSTFLDYWPKLGNAANLTPSTYRITVLGDGDTMQGSSVLWTAAHYSIPVLILVSNNRSNFNDEIHQETVAKMRDRAPVS